MGPPGTCPDPLTVNVLTVNNTATIGTTGDCSDTLDVCADTDFYCLVEFYDDCATPALTASITSATGNIITAGDLAVNGGDITSLSATVNLINTNATTVNFAGTAAVNIGETDSMVTIAGDTTLGNLATADTVTFVARVNSDIDPSATNTYDLGDTALRWRHLWLAGNATVAGDVAVDGCDLTSICATFNLLNATPTTINFGGNAAVNIGETDSMVTIAGDTTLGNSAANDTVTFVARVNSDIDPATTNTYDLGSTGLRWKDLWLAGNADVDGTLNVGGLTTLGDAPVGCGSWALDVMGDADFDCLVVVQGNLDPQGDIDKTTGVLDISTSGVGGNVTINPDGGGTAELIVSSSTPHVTVNSDLNVTNDLDVDNDANVDDNLTVGDLTTLGDDITCGALALDVKGDADFDCLVTVRGNTDLGDATSDTVTFTARVDSDFIPDTDNAYDLGTSALRWQDLWLRGSADIDGTMDVAGLTTLNNGLIVNNAGVTVNGGNLDMASNNITNVNTGYFISVGTSTSPVTNSWFTNLGTVGVPVTNAHIANLNVYTSVNLNDLLDFTDFSDTMTVDAATTIDTTAGLNFTGAGITISGGDLAMGGNNISGVNTITAAIGNLTAVNSTTVSSTTINAQSTLNVNGVLVMASSILSIDDATPDVSGDTLYYTNNTGAAPNVTDFDNGVAGQVIVIVFGDVNTTIVETGNIDLSAAFTSTAGDVLTFVYDGTTWYEVSRSVN